MSPKDKEQLEQDVKDIINDPHLGFIAKLEAIISIEGGQLMCDEAEFKEAVYTLVCLMDEDSECQ